MLNPGDYKLPRAPNYQTEKFTYYGYFIAGDQSDVEEISVFKNQIERETELNTKDEEDEKEKIRRNIA
jgi:hypothetical protein